jgi:hypothetical protein
MIWIDLFIILSAQVQIINHLIIHDDLNEPIAIFNNYSVRKMGFCHPLKTTKEILNTKSLQ